MCGIAGVVGNQNAGIYANKLIEGLAHRGPDDYGLFISEDIAIAMSRLRVRSKLEETIPFATQSYPVVAYNGEVYGKVNSNNKYESYELNGGPDEAELILADDRAGKVDGMYALAYKSPGSNNIVLQRDSFGIKPLFYARLEEGQAFSSELRPLLDICKPGEIRSDSIVDFLVYGSLFWDETFFTGLKVVPPGGIIKLTGKDALVHMPDTTLRSSVITELNEQEVRREIHNAVKATLPSKRSIGLALSGGLDSSILAFELNELGLENLLTISVGVKDSHDGVQDLSELGLQAQGPWKTWKHSFIEVSPRVFANIFDDAIRVLGQPTKLTSVPLYLCLAEQAAAHNIVVLMIGEGADEMFLGYDSYLSLFGNNDLSKSDWFHLIEHFLVSERELSLLERIVGTKQLRHSREKFYAWISELLYESLEDLLRAVELHFSLSPLLLRADHTLMAHSIEGRTPFLHGIVPLVAYSFPSSRHISSTTKTILRNAYGKMLGSISYQPKVAFRAPLNKWFSGPLKNWAIRRLDHERYMFSSVGIFSEGIDMVINALTKNDESVYRTAFALVSLSSWLKQLEKENTTKFQ